MSINISLPICHSLVLNTTGKEWHTFQYPLNKAIGETVYHCLSRQQEMRLVSKAQQHSQDDSVWYELYARITDERLEFAAIRVVQPTPEEN